MRMRMMWRIRAEMRNRGYDLADLIGKTSYGWYYTPNQDSYLPYRGW